MAGDLVAIRGIDKNLYKKLKTRAAEQHLKLNQVINLAIDQYLARPKKVGILNTKTFKFPGKNVKNASREVDEILYGA